MCYYLQAALISPNNDPSIHREKVIEESMGDPSYRDVNDQHGRDDKDPFKKEVDVLFTKSGEIGLLQ